MIGAFLGCLAVFRLTQRCAKLRETPQRDTTFPAATAWFQHGSKMRLAAAAALLFSEYLVISVGVDAASTAKRGGVWSVVAQLGAVGPVLVTTAAAWFMTFRLGAAAADRGEPAGAPVSEHPSHGEPRPVARLPFLVLMAAHLYGAHRRLRSPGVWLALPAGLVLVWAANVVRFAALSHLGVLFEPRVVAVAAFHSKATWVPYCGLTVVFAARTRCIRVRRRAN